VAHRLVRAAILIVAALAGLELALRAASVVHADGPCYVADNVTGYRLRPGSSCGGVTANSLGFPDVEHAAVKPPGVTRIGIVGDSFVVGSVDATARMSAVLAARLGASTEVINLGLPFAGPRNYAGVIAATARPLQLDIICVVIFMGDDIVQSHPDFEARMSWHAPRHMLRAPYILGPSLDYSYAARAIQSGWRAARDRGAIEPDATFSRATFLSIERKRLEIFARRPTPFVAAAYRGAAWAVQRIADETRGTGAQLVIALAPDEMQVDPGVASALLSAHGLNAADFDFDRPARVLAESLGSRRGRVIDLTPPLRDAQQSGPVYLKYNTHWNERGNLTVADYLLTSVKSR
jgi:hypothetical protein